MVTPNRRPLDLAPFNDMLTPYEARPVPLDFDPTSREGTFLPPSPRSRPNTDSVANQISIRLQALYTSGRITSEEMVSLSLSLADLICSQLAERAAQEHQ